MKVSVVGTGMLGGHAALYLRDQGFDITLASRTAPQAPVLKEFPFVAMDYTQNDTDASKLEGFDALLFCAGNDIRHIDPESPMDEQWHQNNAVAIPRFFAAQYYWAVSTRRLRQS